MLLAKHDEWPPESGERGYRDPLQFSDADPGEGLGAAVIAISLVIGLAGYGAIDLLIHLVRWVGRVF